MFEVIHLPKDNECILINTIEYESMCAEFDPGPGDEDPFPEFYNTSITVSLVNNSDNTVKELFYEDMVPMYKTIVGRSERILFWRIMKYLKHLVGE